MRDRPSELRQTATEAEQTLWHFLRDRKFLGLKFRRQHRITPFILDFYCAEKKLCIELDGSVHETEEQMQRDRVRTEKLAEKGITVLRFQNAEVEGQIGEVLQKIRDSCA